MSGAIKILLVTIILTGCSSTNSIDHYDLSKELESLILNGNYSEAKNFIKTKLPSSGLRYQVNSKGEYYYRPDTLVQLVEDHEKCIKKLEQCLIDYNSNPKIYEKWSNKVFSTHYPNLIEIVGEDIHRKILSLKEEKKKIDLEIENQQKQKDAEKKFATEKEEARKTPQYALDQTCYSLRVITGASQVLSEEKKIGNIGGIVNQKRIYEASSFLNSSTNEFNKWSAEYEKRSQSKFKRSLCKD